MAKKPVKTEELAKKVRLLMQLRDIRNFAKIERAGASLGDRIVWEHLYRTVLESAVITEQQIGKLLPSGVYQYVRDLQEP